MLTRTWTWRLIAIAAAAVFCGVAWNGWHYVDWYAWGEATPPDHVDEIVEHPAAELLMLKVDDADPSDSEVTVNAGQPVRFETRLRLKEKYWNEMPSIPSLIRMKPETIENIRSKQMKLPECIFAIEIVCKSSIPPGERVVRRLEMPVHRMGKDKAEWSLSWVASTRKGIYLVRCIIAERKMKAKADDPSSPLFNANVVQTVWLKVE